MPQHPKKKLNTRTPLTIPPTTAETYPEVYIGACEFRQRPGFPGNLTVRLLPCREEANGDLVLAALNHSRELTIPGVAAAAAANPNGLEAAFIKALEDLVEHYEDENPA